MTHEQHLALDLIVRLANRFGPASRIAKELPGWLEYLTEVECAERPRSRPSSQWWNKIRTIAHDLAPSGGHAESDSGSSFDPRRRYGRPAARRKAERYRQVRPTAL